MERLLEFIVNHPLQVGAFALVLGMFVFNEMRRGGRKVTAQELVHLLNRESAVVVDVRDRGEYASGHIVDALHIPYGAIKDRLNELENFREKPVILACRMGQHSGAAGVELKKAGFENVMRLSGGMAEWQNQNLPVVTQE